MKHHIFTRDGELYLITGEVPQKPIGLNYYAGIAQDDVDSFNKETEQYNDALDRLRKEAVRVMNKDYALIGLSVQGQWPEKEGELYEIDCEVEYECDCTESTKNGTPSMCFVCTGRTAILKPLTEKAAETPMSALRNKLGPLFNLVAILKYKPTTEPVTNALWKCDMEGIKKLLGEVEKAETQDELWNEALKLLFSGAVKSEIGMGVTLSYNDLKSKYTITRK